MSLQNEADQYFSSINSIARRMYEDMTETKAAYDKLWPELSEDERDQIVNESIIKPEASLKYGSPTAASSVRDYGLKTIVDDGCSFRDEHSAPFTFRTSSQRELRLFGVTKELPAHHKPKICQSSKAVDNTQITTISDDDITIEMSRESSSSTLPKTGLDFLDNW